MRRIRGPAASRKIRAVMPRPPPAAHGACKLRLRLPRRETRESSTFAPQAGSRRRPQQSRQRVVAARAVESEALSHLSARARTRAEPGRGSCQSGRRPAAAGKDVGAAGQLEVALSIDGILPMPRPMISALRLGAGSALGTRPSNITQRATRAQAGRCRGGKTISASCLRHAASSDAEAVSALSAGVGAASRTSSTPTTPSRRACFLSGGTGRQRCPVDALRAARWLRREPRAKQGAVR